MQSYNGGMAARLLNYLIIIIIIMSWGWVGGHCVANDFDSGPSCAQEFFCVLLS